MAREPRQAVEVFCNGIALSDRGMEFGEKKGVDTYRPPVVASFL